MDNTTVMLKVQKEENNFYNNNFRCSTKNVLMNYDAKEKIILKELLDNTVKFSKRQELRKCYSLESIKDVDTKLPYKKRSCSVYNICTSKVSGDSVYFKGRKGLFKTLIRGFYTFEKPADTQYNCGRSFRDSLELPKNVSVDNFMDLYKPGLSKCIRLNFELCRLCGMPCKSFACSGRTATSRILAINLPLLIIDGDQLTVGICLLCDKVLEKCCFFMIPYILNFESRMQRNVHQLMCLVCESVKTEDLVSVNKRMMKKFIKLLESRPFEMPPYKSNYWVCSSCLYQFECLEYMNECILLTNQIFEYLNNLNINIKGCTTCADRALSEIASTFTDSTTTWNSLPPNERPTYIYVHSPPVLENQEQPIGCFERYVQILRNLWKLPACLKGIKLCCKNEEEKDV